MDDFDVSSWPLVDEKFHSEAAPLAHYVIPNGRCKGYAPCDGIEVRAIDEIIELQFAITGYAKRITAI